VAKIYLFFKHSQLPNKFIEVIKLQLHGDLARFNEARPLALRFSPFGQPPAGARVTMHTRLANFNVPAVQRVDDRTIEVIATGLPLWHGSSWLSTHIDTTLVSPLTGVA